MKRVAGVVVAGVLLAGCGVGASNVAEVVPSSTSITVKAVPVATTTSVLPVPSTVKAVPVATTAKSADLLLAVSWAGWLVGYSKALGEVSAAASAGMPVPLAAACRNALVVVAGAPSTAFTDRELAGYAREMLASAADGFAACAVLDLVTATAKIEVSNRMTRLMSDRISMLVRG